MARSMALKMAAGNRAKLFPAKSHGSIAAVVPEDTDGICKSMVEKHNYVCEEHTFAENPSWEVRRVPRNRPPVLLQHGLLMDGITWLLLPPEQSLAFLLADNGYDVWLANTRERNIAAYWDWSWDELVAYDLPATYKYVHVQTGQKLHYVGHSLGTLIALASFSKSQVLNMLRSAALLAQLLILYTGGILEFDPRGYLCNSAFLPFLYHLSSAWESVIKFLKDICKRTGIDCTNLLTSFTGQNCCLNSSIVDVFLDHEPQSSSTKNMMHLSQMIREGTITMFNYNNKDENRKHYGQPTPPVYKMTNIPKHLPLFLSNGGADALSDVNDVQLLLDSLKDHDGDKLVIQYRADYAHADYVMGENAKQDVYEPLIAFFKLQ
ncbi:hypothetical protein GH714_020271 [Hevea brasiliensis]|uniref:Lipase n=1 Tax=Hevea brasiliensis TaxID=3981 RepID=A0A6A6KWK2_HEVBR|nr:hypothetical protein GH714_020271 [Hevea brasiliensis]